MELISQAILVAINAVKLVPLAQVILNTAQHASKDFSSWVLTVLIPALLTSAK
jgi:hypothetical protein